MKTDGEYHWVVKALLAWWLAFVIVMFGFGMVQLANASTIEAPRVVGTEGQPAYEHGWKAYGSPYGSPRFWKDATGYVHLEGLLNSGSVGESAFTLPEGDRPSSEEIFTSWTGAASAISISASGSVVVGSSSGGYASLTSIGFRPSGADTWPEGGGGEGTEGKEGKEGKEGAESKYFHWRGIWKASTAYAIGDMVEEKGSSYVAIKAMTTGEDTAPPETVFWNLVAGSGEKGEKGEKGEAGGGGSGKVESFGTEAEADLSELKETGEAIGWAIIGTLIAIALAYFVSKWVTTKST